MSMASGLENLAKQLRRRYGYDEMKNVPDSNRFRRENGVTLVDFKKSPSEPAIDRNKSQKS